MAYWIIALLFVIPSTSYSQNLGFKFKDGYCQKERASGFNPNFKGECGMYTGTRIIMAHWKDEKMTAINLNGSYSHRSTFENLDLNNAAYRRGYITESKFNNVKARFLDLRGSWVKGTIWKDSDLENWIANGARIEKTKFLNCNLQMANFWGANLQESDFSGSDLRGANLENTYVLFTAFTGAKFNNKTLLPFSKEEAIKRGMVEVD